MNSILQAFANILDNALKSCNEGLVLTMSVGVVQGQITVTITDNGCGIPQENLPRIFEPFFTTRAVGSGTGMGLTVAHQAITGAGGSVEVASVVGQGTTCRVCLPKELQTSE